MKIITISIAIAILGILITGGLSTNLVFGQPDLRQGIGGGAGTGGGSVEGQGSGITGGYGQGGNLG